MKVFMYKMLTSFHCVCVYFTVEVADADDNSHATMLEKGEVYDLTRPLEGDCKLELVKFEDDIGRTVSINYFCEEEMAIRNMGQDQI